MPASSASSVALSLPSGGPALSTRARELEARRRTAISLLEAGYSQSNVARQLGVSRAAVCHWRRAEIEGGPGALRATPKTGRPRKIDGARSEELAALVRLGPSANGFDRNGWTGRSLCELLQSRWGVAVSQATALRWLRRHSTRRVGIDSGGPGSSVDRPAAVAPGLSESTPGESQAVSSLQYVLSFGRPPCPGSRRQTPRS